MSHTVWCFAILFFFTNLVDEVFKTVVGTAKLAGGKKGRDLGVETG